MIASSYVLAAAVCSILVMFIGKSLGRRLCIMTGDTLVIIGTAIQASAMSVPHIIVGRVICGFGVSGFEVLPSLIFQLVAFMVSPRLLF
jgi:MFS family permease